jgi:hypothetical protein
MLVLILTVCYVHKLQGSLHPCISSSKYSSRTKLIFFGLLPHFLFPNFYAEWICSCFWHKFFFQSFIIGYLLLFFLLILETSKDDFFFLLSSYWGLNAWSCTWQQCTLLLSPTFSIFCLFSLLFLSRCINSTLLKIILYLWFFCLCLLSRWDYRYIPKRCYFKTFSLH